MGVGAADDFINIVRSWKVPALLQMMNCFRSLYESEDLTLMFPKVTLFSVFANNVSS